LGKIRLPSFLPWGELTRRPPREKGNLGTRGLTFSPPREISAPPALLVWAPPKWPPRFPSRTCPNPQPGPPPGNPGLGPPRFPSGKAPSPPKPGGKNPSPPKPGKPAFSKTPPFFLTAQFERKGRGTFLPGKFYPGPNPMGNRNLPLGPNI